jgi:hypothetical protein
MNILTTAPVFAQFSHNLAQRFLTMAPLANLKPFILSSVLPRFAKNYYLNQGTKDAIMNIIRTLCSLFFQIRTEKLSRIKYVNNSYKVPVFYTNKLCVLF